MSVNRKKQREIAEETSPTGVPRKFRHLAKFLHEAPPLPIPLSSKSVEKQALFIRTLSLYKMWHEYCAYDPQGKPPELNTINPTH